MMRIPALLVCLAFLLVPLAQAADCLMHMPHVYGAEHAPEAGHGAGHAAAMPVADCFKAASTGVLPGAVSVCVKDTDHGKVAGVLPAALTWAGRSGWLRYPPPQARPKLAARHDDVLLTTGRRRI